jgi:5-oxoprolinase (ATP-hydrolysing)
MVRSTHSPQQDWQFLIDVGGTFTDCIGVSPSGETFTHKLLSSGIYKGAVLKLDGNSLDIESPFSFQKNFFKGFSLLLIAKGVPQPVLQAIVLDSQPGGTLSLENAPNLSSFAHLSDLYYELRSPEPAPICGIRFLKSIATTSPIGAVSIKLGTTIGTNALLERKGANTALITTVGFRDILAIGTQKRPKLFDLNIKKNRPLYERVAEVAERLDARGRIIVPLNEDDVRHKLKVLLNAGIESLAVSLLHAHRNNGHEKKIETIALAMGFAHVSLSSEVVNLQNYVARSETTLVNAYLTPIIQKYLTDIRKAAPEASLRIMSSSGGLAAAELFQGRDSILSGPAGGVVGMSQIATKTGRKKVIGFDMGGTSTDVSRFDQEPQLRFEMDLQDPKSGSTTKIIAPMLAIETVAAGGGSICWFDGNQMLVGPESAGASPGPACYGNGGPLTITDCNLFLGRLLESSFSFPLNLNAPREKLEGIAAAIALKGRSPSLIEIALGFLQIAASNMAQPILQLSLDKGYDIREYSIVSFGGAGAQHVCQLAEVLGVTSIIQHPMSSILSAWGIGYADARRQKARDCGTRLSLVSNAALELAYLQMEEDIRIEFEQDAELSNKEINFSRKIDLRYLGQDSSLSIPIDRNKSSRELFEQEHQRTFGFVFPEREIEIRCLRTEGTIKLNPSQKHEESTHVSFLPDPEQTLKSWFDNGEAATNVYKRENLDCGAYVLGPAIIHDNLTTLVVLPGWRAAVLDDGLIEVTRSKDKLAQEASDSVDPISLTLFTNMFTSIAEQMGVTLQRTAMSVNVKERLDFSCAVFTAAGDLIVNAPHIPVHLGSMGDTVKAVIQFAGSTLAPGDVFVTNDPYAGGSHLPDVTVITPVWSKMDELLFFTANRAHHAEIGGITPGSMPPNSKNLSEEGVLIEIRHIVVGGISKEEDLRKLLTTDHYPSRKVDDNLADINAQIAANELGRTKLLELVEEYGQGRVSAHLKSIRDAARDIVSKELSKFKNVKRFTDKLDDASMICLEIRPATIAGKTLTLDFSGSSPVCSGNNNANIAIVKAATLYCIRCIVGKNIPLNEGVLEPVELIIPKKSILDPSGFIGNQRPAVTAGNVETSQRLVDVIFGAFGNVAASQGTMNNLLFGASETTDRPGFGYYETICGGSGAGSGFNGCDAVHTHMTNTKITDPEVLEERYPVRLRRFEIRERSGGAGAWSGGNGVAREIEFLEPVELSVIANRRNSAPYGAAGGKDGDMGKNLFKRSGSPTFEEQSSCFQLQANPGDTVLILTPGGGGFGPP